MKFCFCSLSIIILEEWDGMAASQQHAIFQTFLNRGKETFLKDLGTKILPKTSLEDYDIIRSLGHGSYGQVVAAKNVTTGKMCALKVINKKKIMSEDQMKHLISEIRILNATKFEFLVSLECYFTNQCHVFLVLPYVPGGQFLRLLKKVRKLDEFPAKFFAGQIVLAIEYLHANGIVHRDIKPENILLDANGYLKLVDFGFAKVVRNNFTYTFCGTPEYIAPEIVLSKGYSKSPDWWAFGVLLYEMCSGTPPFMSKNELRLYEKILIGHVIFPDYFSSELKSIITGLLQVNKNKRLGCMKSDVEDVKFHDWFKNVDWIALWNKQLISPYTAKKPVENEVLDRYFSFLNTNDCKPRDMIVNIDNGI